jgi:hypothetical protein
MSAAIVWNVCNGWQAVVEVRIRLKMRTWPERLSQPRLYRPVSVALILLSVWLPLGLMRLGIWDWVALLIGLLLYISLVVITYHRLLGAGLSTAWLIPMVLSLNFGPAWHGPKPLVLHASNLIQLIPVILGWLVLGQAGLDAAAPDVRLGS